MDKPFYLLQYLIRPFSTGAHTPNGKTNLSQEQLFELFKEAKILALAYYTSAWKGHAEKEMQLDLISRISNDELVSLLEIKPESPDLNISRLAELLVESLMGIPIFKFQLKKELAVEVFSSVLHHFLSLYQQTLSTEEAPGETKNIIQDAHVEVEGSLHLGDNIVQKHIYYNQPGFDGIIKLTELDKIRMELSGPLRYRDYLYGKVLPYRSRTEFKKVNPNAQAFLTESDILDKLLSPFTSGDYFEGAIIFGEGGIGKTRLMLELGRLALNRGWEVLIIMKEVKNLGILNEHLEKDKKYLLIFDYIEESQSFTLDLREKVTVVKEQNLKLLGNCRNTYLQSSNFPSTDFFLKVHLDRANDWELKYEAHVNRSILKGLDTLSLEDGKLQKIKPSFAVFLRYWADSDRSEGLQGSGEFRGWLKRRMELSFRLDDFSKLPKEVIYILVCLPIGKQEEGIKIEQDYSHIIEKLLADGWIDDTILEISNNHDTIADELLMLHLKGTTLGSFQRRIASLLAFSAEYGKIDNWLRAFERVMDQLSQPQLNLIVQTIDKRAHLWMDQTEKLGVTPLLNETQWIQLFHKHQELFNHFVASPGFAKPLSYALNQLNKKEEDQKSIALAMKILQRWLAANRLQEIKLNYSSRILSTAINLNGWELMKNYVHQYVNVPFLPDRASYVLAAWLNAGGEIASLEPMIWAYFEERATWVEAQFVFSAWADAGGELEKVKAYFKQFLEQHLEMPTVGIVLQKWLEKETQVDWLQPSILKYWQNHQEQPESRFVLEKFLEKTSNLTELENLVKAYLDRYATALETQFLFRAWIKNGGTPRVIQAYLKEHLELYASSKTARFVIQDWIEFADNPFFISPYLDQFFRKNPTLEEGRFVLQAWLNAGNDPLTIEDYVLISLDNYKRREEAKYLLFPAIQHGFTIKKLEPSLLDWFTHFGQTADSWNFLHLLLDKLDQPSELSSYVEKVYTAWEAEKQAFAFLRNWLDRNWPLEPLRFVLARWLLAFGQTSQGLTLIQHWIRAENQLDELEEFFSIWLKNNQEATGIHYVIQTWWEAGGRFLVIRDPILDWLNRFCQRKEANFILELWLKSEEEPTLVGDHLSGWLENNFTQTYAHITIEYWLDAGGDPNLVRLYAEKWLETHGDRYNGRRLRKLLQLQ